MVLFDELSPNDPPPDGDLNKIKLARNYGADKESRPNLGDTAESLCVQFLNLSAFPSGDYICSSHHSGQTQVSFGSNYRRKADCLISVEEDSVEMVLRAGEEVQVSPGHWKRGPAKMVPKRENKRRFLRYFNFHGLRYHGSGQHLPSCPKYVPPETVAAAMSDDWDATSLTSCTKEDQEEAASFVQAMRKRLMKEEEEKSMAKAGLGGSGDSGGGRGVKRRKGISADSLTGECAKRHRQLHPATGGLPPDRDDQDLLKEEYARAMTRVDPDKICVTYAVVHECTLLHGATPPDPSQWNKLTRGSNRGKEHDSWDQYKTVREYLGAEFPEQSLLGTRLQSFTQGEIVAKIMSSGLNAIPGQEFGGFAVVTGGKEGDDCQDGVVPGSFGFCHQRTGLDEDQVGQFTKMQAKMQCGDAETAAKVIKKLAAQQGTLSRTSFSEEGGEVLTLDYLRFLIRFRKFSGFRLRHLIVAKHKHWLSGFIDSMLQRRHELKNVPNSELLSTLLKLVLNGKRLPMLSTLSTFYILLPSS
jgi:hypothetical protein